jgi:nucleoside-diphosphate-sugar epimerase
MQTNLLGTHNLLQACRKQAGLLRVLVASTSEVYGSFADRTPEEEACANLRMDAPRWSYAVSKLGAERLALAEHARHGLPVTVVRPFNAYGPGQVGQGAVHTLVRRALGGLPLELHNGGGQVRAWCYIEDMVAGLVLALFEPAAVGRVFNLGNPEEVVSVRELAVRIAAAAGSTAPLVPVPRPGPEVHLRIPDISAARRLLGFRPRVTLDDGLRRTVAWYREARPEYPERLPGF